MSIPAKILVVDNRRFLRDFLCSLLAGQSDWDVYEAENGEVALDRIQEVKPDVVVLAVMMPEMNGLELASRIRNLAPETRVIFMSVITLHKRPQLSPASSVAISSRNPTSVQN